MDISHVSDVAEAEMVRVGSLVRLEAKAGKEEELEGRVGMLAARLS